MNAYASEWVYNKLYSSTGILNLIRVYVPDFCQHFTYEQKFDKFSFQAGLKICQFFSLLNAAILLKRRLE